jgi:hypothetical protein
MLGRRHGPPVNSGLVAQPSRCFGIASYLLGRFSALVVRTGAHLRS